MTEPDVAITDFLLAAETALFALLLWRERGGNEFVRRWSIALFASLCAASLAGGLTHGFFLDEKSTGHAILWPATLLAIGMTALCLSVVAARVGLRAATVLTVIRGSAAALVLYALVILFVKAEFYVAIIAYLPAVLFLLVVLFNAWRRTREQRTLEGVLAVILTLIASGIQQASFSVPGVPHANNVLYHVLEAVALFMLFRSLAWLCNRARV